MRRRGAVVLWLAAILWSCGRPAPREPLTCETPLPQGLCEEGATQRCGDTWCECKRSYCSGAMVDENAPPPRPLWSCKSFPAECPKTTPSEGVECSIEGLKCNYADCGGTVATCSDGVWKHKLYAPPP